MCRWSKLCLLLYRFAPLHLGPEYSLAATEVDDVRAYLDHLLADHEKTLEVALRRFTRGYDRETDEDRLIDYLLCPSPGGKVWYEVDLEPGTYTAGCGVLDPSREKSTAI